MFLLLVRVNGPRDGTARRVTRRVGNYGVSSLHRSSKNSSHGELYFVQRNFKENQRATYNS